MAPLHGHLFQDLLDQNLWKPGKNNMYSYCEVCIEFILIIRIYGLTLYSLNCIRWLNFLGTWANNMDPVHMIEILKIILFKSCIYTQINM